ncbi:deoxyribodipyrimidine photo-lyase [Komagataeibacter rhaeticus]|uniref:cryptochrome/photolyase family protein n=1 Tax=Komagataeibacter rhaeticus TaxID=215221 RepID=UPI0004D5792E|nr:deoxyribodipyrimidine photo-lyase [Komagataeibacter rhaeticus]KDU96684.1 deoxyribodipyrimidine photolyase [Komagataeibacter rhaeticus AF1]MBL7239687.1 deoxyribodipyrimidine photo-lyase [Komagataeibacter rhaeticus]PYD53137.1 deoxyribodipyrimidine photo-lyase [Komagataeibacter rhaeticus]GBQ13148.1 deoxyribodipyrimidine photolyase [Komagataeibacter rhaeticus DSM 16663]
MSQSAPTIMWFRDDLRLADNPALSDAAASGPVICLYVHDPALAPGSAARWWLHGALTALEDDLRARGGRLCIMAGPAWQCVLRLARQAGAGAVVWNRRYGGAARQVDARIKLALKDMGVQARSHRGNMLHEPWQVRTRQGAPFRVYTPWWRAVRATGAPLPPLPVPAALGFAALPPAVEDGLVSLSALELQPTRPDWAQGLRDTWQPGEQAAHARLATFMATRLPGYARLRDLPARPATSGLSPCLRFGHISPRQIWHAVEAQGDVDADGMCFLSEVGWRDFAHATLFDCPDMATRSLRPEYDRMPWRTDPAGLRAWQQGRTGYPIVDAGMRELWHTGWMHNRVRMIVASFLTKHLLLDWRAGERWFADTLVDADGASNPFNWQWVAGCGLDAAPYFRIFNPVLQGEKFDPEGDYVRRWVPEIAHLAGRAVHTPWKFPHVHRGYPAPVVDLADGRARALAAWKTL